METDVFQRIATLVTLADLTSALGPKLDAAMPIRAALELLEATAATGGYNPMARVSLVADSQGEAGSWVDFQNLATAEDSQVGAAAAAVSAGDMLTDSTTALHAAKLLCLSDRPRFFVLHNNDIVGTVGFTDLFALPFRLCLFSLTLQLEAAALSLLARDADASIAALTEQRRGYAGVVFAKRFGSSIDQSCLGLLRCTTFIDKAKILSKRKLVAGYSKKRVQSIFSRAERVRNHCAHPDSIEGEATSILNKGELSEFIGDAALMTKALSQLVD
jgi:hypothetical protein